MLAPFDEGGPGTVAYHLLKELSNVKRIRLTLVVSDSVDESALRDQLGPNVQEIIRIPKECSVQSYAKLFTTKATDIWKALSSVDLVHVNNYWPLRNFYFPLFAASKSLPLIYTCHGISMDPYQGENGQSVKKLAMNAIVRIT